VDDDDEIIVVVAATTAIGVFIVFFFLLLLLSETTTPDIGIGIGDTAANAGTVDDVDDDGMGTNVGIGILLLLLLLPPLLFLMGEVLLLGLLPHTLCVVVVVSNPSRPRRPMTCTVKVTLLWTGQHQNQPFSQPPHHQCSSSLRYIQMGTKMNHNDQ
jgi:hypothetical protein